MERDQRIQCSTAERHPVDVFVSGRVAFPAGQVEACEVRWCGLARPVRWGCRGGTISDQRRHFEQIV